MCTVNPIQNSNNHQPAFMRISNEKELFSRGRTLWYHYSKNFGSGRELIRSYTKKLAQGCGLPVSFVERAINHYLTH